MRCALAWSFAALLVASCVLPGIDVDPSLGSSSAGTGFQGGPESGGSSGTGGSTSAQGGTGNNLAGADAGDSPLEVACGDYCPTYLQNCKDSPANMYSGLADCLDTCFTAGWPLGSDTTEPNSLQCRVVHAHLAKDLPDPHCFHSAKIPSGASCTPPQ
jgi:hypothetical protein